MITSVTFHCFSRVAIALSLVRQLQGILYDFQDKALRERLGRGSERLRAICRKNTLFRMRLRCLGALWYDIWGSVNIRIHTLKRLCVA